MRINSFFTAMLIMFAVITSYRTGAALVMQNTAPTNQAKMVEVTEKPAVTETQSTAPETFSQKQARLLKIAYDIGVKVGVDPTLVQAVILQETLAGGLKSYKVANTQGEPYYGVGQIKLAATKDVLKRFPSMYEEYGFHTKSDDEIIAHLILDEKFNIEVAARYILILQTSYGYKGIATLVAYNKGPGGARGVNAASNRYATEAMKKFRESSIAQSFY